MWCVCMVVTKLGVRQEVLDLNLVDCRALVVLAIFLFLALQAFSPGLLVPVGKRGLKALSVVVFKWAAVGDKLNQWLDQVDKVLLVQIRDRKDEFILSMDIIKVSFQLTQCTEIWWKITPSLALVSPGNHLQKLKVFLWYLKKSNFN